MAKEEDGVPDLYQGLLAIIEVIQETRRFAIDPRRADTDAIAVPNSGFVEHDPFSTSPFITHCLTCST